MTAHKLRQPGPAATGDHPAVIAWLSTGKRDAIAVVEPIKESRKSSVYRLRNAGPDGDSVIAKRSWRAAAVREHTLYEEILSGCPVGVIEFLGYADDGDGEMGWVFLGDLGDETFDEGSMEHRKAAARWLGGLHTWTAGFKEHPVLDDRGPSHYLGVLGRARSAIEQSFGNPSLSPGNREVLRQIVRHLDEIESHWPEVDSVCALLPPTLVHGDFTSKNIGLRQQVGGVGIAPFDWEMAGRGVPVTDLANVHAPTYLGAVTDVWPALTLRDVEALAGVGWVFRLVEWVSWARFRLKRDWAGLAIERKLRYYNAWLTEAMAKAPWAREGQLR